MKTIFAQIGLLEPRNWVLSILEFIFVDPKWSLLLMYSSSFILLNYNSFAFFSKGSTKTIHYSLIKNGANIYSSCIPSSVQLIIA